MKTYFIDVLLRGDVSGRDTGEEPIIAATRVAVQIPEMMEPRQMARAIGEEVRKVGLHFLDHSDQLGISIERYEEAIDEGEPDLSNVPPEFRPN